MRVWLMLVLVWTRVLLSAWCLVYAHRLLRECREQMGYRQRMGLNGVQSALLANEAKYRRERVIFFWVSCVAGLLHGPFIHTLQTYRTGQLIGATLWLGLTISAAWSGVYLKCRERNELLRLAEQQRKPVAVEEP